MQTDTDIDQSHTSLAKPQRHAWGDLLFSTLLIGLATIILIDIRDMPLADDVGAGPGLFPGIISVMLVVLSFTLAAKSVLSLKRIHRPTTTEPAEPSSESDLKYVGLESEDVEVPHKGQYVRALLVLIIGIAYVYMSDILGYWVAMSVTLASLLITFKNPLLKSVLVAIIGTTALWLVFSGILGVRLPESTLW